MLGRNAKRKQKFVNEALVRALKTARTDDDARALARAQKYVKLEKGSAVNPGAVRFVQKLI